MADNYEIDLEIEGGEQPDLVMNVQGGEQPELNLQTEGGATDGASARNAEAWANGTRNGVPVTEGDPAYHNNSKYYRDSAAAIVAGDIIDDDAGIGDYNLTWSADKLAKGDESKAPVINVSDQTSAAVKTLTDGADGMPMGVTVEIEPVQAGSGDPSPENVRPISGWSAVKISRTGKNLFDGVVEAGYISDDGTTGTDNVNCHSKNMIPVSAGKTYTYSCTGNYTAEANRRIHGYDLSGNWVCMIDKNTTSGAGKKEKAFTVPSGVCFIKIQFYYPSSVTTRRDTNIQVEAGSSATDYEAFSGHTYEITIPSTPGTVYGGSLTVNKDGTGKLVVEYGMTTIPEITEFHDSSSGTGKTVWVPTSGTNTNVSNKPPICENVQGTTFVSRGAAWTACISTTAGRTLIFVPADLTIAEANTALQGSKIVYRRATPAEYPLTAEQVNALITSLKGINNLYADSGDVLEVEYSADTKLYVDEHNEAEDTAITSIKGMIADSDVPVATASHAIGDVFICGNELLRATSVIVSGETISTGTGGNAETINLADYIAEQVTAIAGLRTDVNALKALPTPPNDFLLKKLGFADFTYTNTSYGTIKMESNVLTASGGSGSTYCHVNLLGTHRVKTGAWGNYTPQSEDFVDIDAYWKVDNSYHARKFCLRNVGSASSGEGTLRVVLAKNNGDDTYTYKYVSLGNGRANLGLLDGSPVDLHDWDKISIVFTSMSRPYTLKTYFYIEDGDGGNYILNNM